MKILAIRMAKILKADQHWNVGEDIKLWHIAGGTVKWYRYFGK